MCPLNSFIGTLHFRHVTVSSVAPTPPPARGYHNVLETSTKGRAATLRRIMRRILLFTFWFGLLSAGRLFADVVTLKDGRQISGSVESGNTQELRIKIGDQSQTIDIHQVQAIQFGVSLPAPAGPPPPKEANLAPEPARACLQPKQTLAGRGLKIAPETPFTNWLNQSAIIDSGRGRQ